MGARRGGGRGSGAAVLGELRKALADGWSPGLTVLTGEDTFHLDAAQRLLLERLVPEAEAEMSLTVLDDGKFTPADLVAAARSAAMFAPRRVVLLREVAALDGDPGPLRAYAGDPPPESYLIVRAPKLDSRRKLHKALLTAGRTLEFAPADRLDSASLLREVAAMAEEHGLQIGRTVAGYLVEACGGDLYRVDSELEKLAVWAGQNGPRKIGVGEVREVVSGGTLMSGWEIADAVMERDLPGALAAVRRLVDGGEEPIRLVGGLAWRARSLVQAKALESARVPAERIGAAVRVFGGRRRPFFDALGRYTIDELLAFPGALLDADRRLKSSSLEPVAVMEQLVRRLIAPTKERA